MGFFTPYYRCTVDMITDVKFKKLFHKYGKDVYAVYWMWHKILTDATKMGGDFNQGSNHPHDELSLLSTFDLVAVTHGIDFIKKVMADFTSEEFRLLSNDDGLMRVMNWEKYQYVSSADRVERFRKTSKETEDTIDAIMNTFNTITKKNCKIKTESYRKLIRGRLSEGHTKEDFEKVIAWKHNMWSNDPKMSIYVRPDTLFRPGHFDTYLNEIPKSGYNKVLTSKDVTPVVQGQAPTADDVIRVRDIYGRERVITQAQFDKAEEGFFTKI